MKIRSTAVAAGVALALGLSGLFVVRAGDLDPPAGPVAPTMVTLDDIYGAITAGPSAPTSTTTYVMQVQGVRGEINEPPFPNDSIPIDTVQFGAARTFTGGGGGGGGFTATTFSDITVSGPLDSALPQLMVAVVGGSLDVKIQGYTTNNTNGNLELFSEVILARSTVLSVSSSGSDLVENSSGASVSFFIDTLCIKHAPIDPVTGAVDGPFEEFCWNVATNSSCACP